MSRFASDAVKNISPYVPGEQPRDRVFIKLNTNESPYPPSPRVLAALSREEVAKLNLYSDPVHTDLKEGLASAFGLSPEHFILTNGSDEVLAFIFGGLLGKRVLLPEISYGFYPVYCRLFGIEYESIPLAPDLSVDHTLWRGRSEPIVFANPNAQTGTLMGLDAIRETLAEDRDRLVVVDEAYIDFGGESALPLIREFDNLIVVRTFSKSRALAGARVGFAAASPELIADLEKIRNSFNPYNLNRLSLLAAAAALEDEAYFESCRRSVILNRERLTAYLAARGFTLTDSYANFMLVGYPGFTGPELAAALRDRGILVRYINEERIRDRVRITVGDDRQMDALAHELIDIVNNK